MRVHTHSCPNQFQAHLLPHGALPLLSLQCWVQTGSQNEAPFLGSGLSHLLEHMVFKGTQSYTAEQLAQKVQSLGGSWNAYTSTDRTVYYIDGPATHWREFLHLLYELVFLPTFPQEEWDCEREVIRREMAMYDDDPQDVAYRLLNETLFQRHPRRYPVIGHLKNFDALSYQDMCAYHQAHYAPDNAFLSAAVGHDCISPKEWDAEIERLFGSLKPQKISPFPLAQEPRQWGHRFAQKYFEQASSTVMFAWRIPHAQHPDAPALSLLSHILGHGRSAFLYQALHDSLGLAHDISASLMPSKSEQGALIIEAECDSEEVGKLLPAIRQVLAQIPTRPDLAQALQRALNEHKVQHLKRQSSVEDCASMLGMAWHHSGNIHYFEEWQQALHRVQLADLVRVCQTYLSQEADCELHIDPPACKPEQSEQQAEEKARPCRQLEFAQGLRVVLYRDAAQPLVHATLAFGAGCAAETQASSGIHALMSEMMLKGTYTRTATQIAEQLENLGACINSDVGNNTLCLSASCLKEDVESMLDVLADVSIHPSFPEEFLEQEKEALIVDIKDNLEDPLALAFRHLRQHCFGPVAYGLSPEGDVESIEKLQRSDLVRQHAISCCAQNAVLSLVGDIEEEALPALIDKYFAPMPAGQPITRQACPPQQAGDHHISCDKQQAVLTLALPALSVLDKRFGQLSLLLEWLRDMAGPIFTELREKRGLAYYASASSFCGVDTGSLYFYLGTSEQQLPEAREALQNCLQQIAQEGMSPEAWQHTRKTALAHHMMNIQSAERISSSLAVDTLLGLPLGSILQWGEQVEGIQHEDIQRLIAELLAEEQNHTWVSVSA